MLGAAIHGVQNSVEQQQGLQGLHACMQRHWHKQQVHGLTCRAWHEKIAIDTLSSSMSCSAGWPWAACGNRIHSRAAVRDEPATGRVQRTCRVRAHTRTPCALHNAAASSAALSTNLAPITSRKGTATRDMKE